MSERKWKARRRAERERLGTDAPSGVEPGPSGRERAARENMRAARARNEARVREQYHAKVAGKAMAMGRAERRRYLKDVRRKDGKGATR